MALAVFLFFSLPDKAAAIALSIVVLVVGAVVGTGWELAALREQRNPVKGQLRSR